MANNTYADIVNENRESVQLQQTVTKILKYIDDLRNHNSEVLARRWPIELIQNANDVAYNEQKVRIKFLYTENDEGINVKFMHNGKPFSTKNVLHLINQVSSKVNETDTTGKFGTGFMTTYLLSEKVKIEGVAKDNNMPYKKFSFSIDRSDNSADGVKASLSKSTKEFLNIDNNEVIKEETFDTNQFNTIFSYILDNDRSVKCAKLGIDDLIYNVKFIMAFNEKIESIEIEKNICNKIEKRIFKKVNEEILDNENEIKNITIKEEGDSSNEYHILTIMTEGVTVGRETNKGNRILAIDKKTSRIYRDFPLVGTEKHYVPFIVNSKNFMPNETRSSISITDNENSIDSIKNKKNLQIAINLYKKLFIYLLNNNYKNIQEMMFIPLLNEADDLSVEWVTKNIYEDLYNFFEKQNFVDTKCGLKKLEDNDCYILDGTKDEINALKDLLSYMSGIYYSISMNNLSFIFNNYYCTIDKYDIYYFMNDNDLLAKHNKKHLYSIKTFAYNINELVNKHLIDKKKYIEVLKKLYDILSISEYEPLITSVDEKINFEIFPVVCNDNNIDNSNIKLYSLNNIYVDSTTEDDLKNIDMQLLFEDTYRAYNNHQKNCISKYCFNNVIKEMYKRLLPKEFELNKNHKAIAQVLNDNDIINDLNNKFHTFAQNDINIQNENVQLLAMKFLSYILQSEDNEDGKAIKYFPLFASEEMKNKLRSSKQLADMSIKYTKIEKVLKNNGYMNIDELFDDMAKFKENACNDEYNLDEIIPLGFFGSNEEKEAFARLIGKYGEDVVYEELSNKIEEEKIFSNNRIIELEKCDTDNYKKSGYDFIIYNYDKVLKDDLSFDRNSDSRVEKTYIEVKTHEINARRGNVIHISREQYKMAIKNVDNYEIYKVDVDSKNVVNTEMWQTIKITKYNDILKCQLKNELLPSEGSYWECSA